MKKFNLFKPFLATCPKIGPFYVLAYIGDDTKYASDYTYSCGKKIPYDSPQMRKSESDKMTGASIHLFDPRTDTYTIKSTYRNTKGVYFNDKPDKYYIQ